MVMYILKNMGILLNAAAAISSRLGRGSTLIKTARPLYNRVLDFLYAETGTSATVGGETFSVCRQARNYVSLETDVYQYLKENIRPGSTVLDVGSFIGLYAILAARWTGKKGRVLTFEPTPTTLPVLHQHLAMNHVLGIVTPLACAIGRTHGVVEFFQHDEPYRNSVGTSDPDVVGNVSSVQVPMLSIDEACTLFAVKPDVMRIDVQGLEAEVLRGAKQTIQQCPHLKIIVEVHPQLWHLHDLDEAKFRALLKDLDLNASSPEGGPAVYAPDVHVVLQRTPEHVGT